MKGLLIDFAHFVRETKWAAWVFTAFFVVIMTARGELNLGPATSIIVFGTMMKLHFEVLLKGRRGTW